MAEQPDSYGGCCTNYVGNPPITVSRGHISITEASATKGGYITTGEQHIAGTKAFDALPSIPLTPVAPTDAASKGYVDSMCPPPPFTATVHPSVCGPINATSTTFKFVLQHGFVQMSFLGIPATPQVVSSHMYTTDFFIPENCIPTYPVHFNVLVKDNNADFSAECEISPYGGSIVMLKPGFTDWSGIGNIEESGHKQCEKKEGVSSDHSILLRKAAS